MGRRARPVDRAAAVRQAARVLVARHGLHGASMGAIARHAGVAAGTAYVHYPSKDELLIAAFIECKHDLGAAVASAVDALDPLLEPAARFAVIWHAVHRHFAAEPERAAFVMQIEVGPYAERARARIPADDPLVAEARRPEMAACLSPLPQHLLFDLAFGPALRAAAVGSDHDQTTLDALATACWRAVTT